MPPAVTALPYTQVPRRTPAQNHASTASAVAVIWSWLRCASKDTAVKPHRVYYHLSFPQCTHKLSTVTLQLKVPVRDPAVALTLCPAQSAANRKAMESSHCRGTLVIHKLFNTWYFKSWKLTVISKHSPYIENVIECETPTLNTEPARFLYSKGDVHADPSPPDTLKSSEMQQNQRRICTVKIKSSLTQTIQY